MSTQAATRDGDGVVAGDPLVLARCTAVSRTFGSGPGAVPAVRAVNCQIRTGTRLAVVGPSGSGKSTLLHLLAGLETPTGGTVTWPGLRARPGSTPTAGSAGGVAMVFQGPSLIPALDVIENVALPLLLAGTGQDAAVEGACAALDRLQIGGLGRKLPEELSGGQAQRVAVARVLVCRPRLILADEPTGQLDRDTGDRVISVLLQAAAELDAALVVSTHDMVVADRLGERWQMLDGHLTGPDPARHDNTDAELTDADLTEADLAGEERP